MYRVQLRKKARKSLSKIPRLYRLRILTVFIRLRNNPYLGESLEGTFKGKYSFHVHPYRVIYEVYENHLLVHVVKIKHRKDAYKNG